jgi:hypothetical protein
MASFGPAWRSRYFAILDVALLRLRLQNSCGLSLKPKSTISGWTLILIMRPLKNIQLKLIEINCPEFLMKKVKKNFYFLLDWMCNCQYSLLGWKF